MCSISSSLLASNDINGFACLTNQGHRKCWACTCMVTNNCARLFESAEFAFGLESNGQNRDLYVLGYLACEAGWDFL